VRDVISLRRRQRRAPGSTLVLATATVVLLAVTVVLAVRRPAIDSDRVELPYTLTGDGIPPGAAVITIDAAGMVHASTGAAPSAAVADADGVQRLAVALVERDPGRAFVIRADRATPWELVQRVATALRDAGAHGIFLLSRQRVLDEEL
jgi:biopolymer transport protein ExbD